VSPTRPSRNDAALLPPRSRSPARLPPINSRRATNNRTEARRGSVCSGLSCLAWQAWEYLDIVVGNESEAEEMGKAFGFAETDVKGIAQAAAKMPKKNASKPRMVVITQGSLATIVATPDSVQEFPVPTGVKVVDTNGAGDAFCGGFFAGLMQGKSIEDSVNCGHYTAGVVIQRSGCQYADAERYKF